MTGRPRAGAAAVALLVAIAMLGACTPDPRPSTPTPSDSPPTAAAPETSSPTTADQHTTPPGGGATLFGASFQRRSGETYHEALARTDRTLGLEMVRVFYPGAPSDWPGVAPDHDVVVSFKLDPDEVVSGEHDELMSDWFENAPRDRAVYWVYWHEPENDTESGQFTPEEFRQAFAHLDELADRADNPALSSTVVLMSYSLDPESGRDWHEWFPPAGSVDVLAWDVYNRGGGSAFYPPPEELLGPLQEASASVGKAYALAELASPRAPGDKGGARAEWLTSVGCHLVHSDALFVAYFDFLWNEGRDDYRLRDRPSKDAWRALGDLTPDDPRCLPA